MTSILAVFDTAAYGPGELAVRSALIGTHGQVDKTVRVHSETHAVLAIGHRRLGPHPLAVHPPGLAMDDGYIVLADATFYHLAALRRALGDGFPASTQPAEMVLAAFRAFGQRCVDYLEGDFAFAIWDRRRRIVFCARDFTGRRPLFLAEWRGGLVVASSLDSVAALPGFDAQVNFTAVAADAAGLIFSQDDETCMRGVYSLRAGHSASWSASEALRTRRYWQPSIASQAATSFEDAAVQLRELLMDAVSERTNATGATAVWMSGGRDSTAVFAAGMEAHRLAMHNSVVRPISRSHPIGDTGREDEAIGEIAAFWRSAPDWVSANDTPLFASQRGRKRWSAEPFAQPFEGLTRALARATRNLGIPVALDGYGGDFLFQVSRVYLADLVASGRITRAVKEWRVMDAGREGARGFFHHALRPLLPRWAASAARAARGGRPLRRSLERNAPPWIRDDFLRQHALGDRFASLGPDSQQVSSAADRETRFYLSHQFFPRVNAKMAGFALDEGVELRSPLLDRRVVEFALSRPRDERNDAGDHKRLLRAAMRGLLPDSVLGVRRIKTGTLASYFARHMRSEGLRLLDQLGSSPALADSGIIEPNEFERAVARYRVEGSSYPFVESLYCTLQAEAWLSARTTGRESRTSARRRAQAI